MMKKSKYLGLLAMLPLFTITLAIGYSADADAVGGLGTEAAKEKLKISESPPVDLSLIPVKERNHTADTSQKSYKGFDESQYDNTLTYRTTYRVVNAAYTDVKNVKISVISDTESIETMLHGHLDPKHSLITTKIKAIDPDSINAKIIGWELG